MKETKRCPYCGEEILAVAKKCKHCGEWLNKNEEKVLPVQAPKVAPNKHKFSDYKLIAFMAVLIFVIVAFFIASKVQRHADSNVLEKTDPVINFSETQTGEVVDKQSVTPKSQIDLQKNENSQGQDMYDSSTEDESVEDLLTLGETYEEGIAVEEDLDKAFYYYNQAAEAGNPVALNKIGNMYAKGKGCSKNMYKAAYYYKAAAEKGNKYAQHNIAYCYWDGTGVEQNRDLAIKWMRRSAAQGFESAVKALNMMTAE